MDRLTELQDRLVESHVNGLSELIDRLRKRKPMGGEPSKAIKELLAKVQDERTPDIYGLDEDDKRGTNFGHDAVSGWSKALDSWEAIGDSPHALELLLETARIALTAAYDAHTTPDKTAAGNRCLLRSSTASPTYLMRTILSTSRLLRSTSGLFVPTSFGSHTRRMVAKR